MSPNAGVALVGFDQHGADILAPGMTRQHVLRLADKVGIPFVPTRVTLPHLLAADEVILFGTTIEVLPVVRVDDHSIGNGRPGPIACRLYRAFQDELDHWIGS